MKGVERHTNITDKGEDRTSKLAKDIICNFFVIKYETRTFN